MPTNRYYKYQGAGAARPALANGTLRWSRPTRFNDLFDMSVPFSTDFDAELIVSRTLELMWQRVVTPGGKQPLNKVGIALELSRTTFLVMGKEKFFKEMRPGVEELVARLPKILDEFSEDVLKHLSTVKVLCLSSVKDDNGMWGLYGNNEGVVLEFINVPELDSVYRLARPVQYADSAPPMLTDEEMAEFFAGDRKLLPSIADPLMFYKTTRWRDENELRLVSGEGRLPGQEVEDIPFHPRELVGIYFGARAGELRKDIEPMVRKKYPHATLWQAFKGKGMKIEFTEIHELDSALKPKVF